MSHSIVDSCSKDSETSFNQALTIDQKYQISFLKLLFTRGYSRELKNFQLESNVEDVYEFNDVIFDEGRYSNHFMKFNCFEDKEKNITVNDLFDGEFCLLKYICAYKKLKTERRFKDAFIKSLIVFTNIRFDLEKDTYFIIDNQSLEKIEFQEIPIGEKNLLYLKTVELKCFSTVDPKIIRMLKNKAKELSSSVALNKLHVTLKDLNGEDITEALKILIFVVTPSDPDEFQKSVEQQIATDLKAKISERAQKNLEELIFNFLNNNDVLTYDLAEIFVEENLKKGVEGLHGHMYAVALTMLLYTRVYFRKIESINLETEVKKASKFDDIVYSTKTKNNSLEYRFIQLKHKQNNNSKINYADLFGDFNSNFSLIKYVCSYWVIKNNPAYKQCLIKDTIVFTNTSFSLDEKNKGTTNNPKRMKFEDTKKNLTDFSFKENDILKFKKFPNVKYYKFEDLNTVKILLEQQNNLIQLQTEKENKKSKSKDSKLKVELQETLNSLSKQSIEEALNHIVFAFNQPNESEVFEMIQNEMKEFFKLQSVETTFLKLKNILIEWIKGNSILHPKINYSDIERFFQENVKNYKFEIPSTTQEFVGRQTELEKVWKILNLENSIAILQSNTVRISGLGGIGKSELAKQFIERYKDDYYGRVIWIDAKNHISIKMKIDRILGDLDINLDRNSLIEEEKIKQKISKILDFFKDMKILFVFDNVDNVEEPKGSFDCLTYFSQEISTMSNKPHILITTRNSSYGGKNISKIPLTVLSEDEAVEMVKQHLGHFFMTDDDEVKQLVNLLHCFPLAIKQAIAYIKKEHEAAENMGGKFTITQYIETYKKKKAEELLDFRFVDDCGNEYSQTTFMTWNVTIDAIKTQKYGKDAIRVLEFVAYFDADEIDLELLKLLLEDPESIGHTIQILKTYSLINQNVIVNDKKEPVYNIHRLVQEVQRIKNKKNGVEYSLLDELLEAIRYDEKTSWEPIDDDAGSVYRILSFALKYDELIKNRYKDDFPINHYWWDYCYSSRPTWKMIHFAACFNDCSVIDCILRLDQDYDLNITDDDNSTPLHIAASSGNIEFVKHLIGKGVSLDCTDRKNRTPFDIACQYGKLEVVECCFEQGVVQSTVNTNTENLLYFACKGNRLDVVKYLVGKDVKLNDSRRGHTPFQIACSYGHLEIVKYFIKEVKSYDFIGKDGFLAILQACFWNRLEIFKYLATEGVSLKTVYEKNETLLHLSCKERIKLEIVKFLVEKGVELNVANNDGHTPFHLACMYDHLELVEYLVKNGVEINVTDNEGRTPFHFACIWGGLEIVKYFIEKVRSFDITVEGSKAVKLTVEKGILEVLIYLTGKGVSLKTIYEEDQTLLHRACLCGRLKIVKHLVFWGLPLDAVDKNGHNIMHMAASVSSGIKIIKYLLEENVPLNEVDKLGRTALHIASIAKNSRVIEFLRANKNVDVSIKDIHGKIASDYAKKVV